MKRLLVSILVSAFMFSNIAQGLCGGDAGEEIQILKEQVQQLMQRIDQLERQQAVTKEEASAAKAEVAKIKESGTGAAASRVDLANALSKLKMNGRIAAGYFNSGKAGSFPAGSFEAPEGKIQFKFEPDAINTAVMRFNLNNAAFNSVDYFFLQSKDFLPFLKNTPFSLSSRLGRFKLGFGEETWSDNPVEGILPSNSAPKTGVSDEGIELAGKIKLADLTGIKSLKPLGWAASVSDGNTGTGSDSTASKAFLGKLSYTPIDPLYLSASYYNSGELDSSTSEFSIGGVATSPVTGMGWRREVWEVDARYDFGKGKKPLDPPAYSDSKAIVRLSYGEFSDEANRSRHGNFGFADAIYNLNKKVYAAGRVSFVDLAGDVTASINSATANRYTRYSLGGGYRWTENTIIKLSYDWNKSTGNSSGTDDADDNLLSAVVGTQF